MGKCIYLRKGKIHTAPVGITPLSQLVEGSIIKINESGSPVEFYVAKHDYESSLNGTGRTLVVRKDCHSRQVWDSNNLNRYIASDINTWLTKSYIELLDSDIQDAIGTTIIKQTTGNGVYTVDNYRFNIFLLSIAEHGLTNSNANAEGSSLPIANVLLESYADGAYAVPWSRTPAKNNPNSAFYITTPVNSAYCKNSYWARPAFTLPDVLKIDENGNVHKVRYTRLSYIESTGTQYIDTGFAPNQNTSFEMDFDFSTANNSGNIHILSANDADKFFAFRANTDFTAFQARYYNAGLQNIPMNGSIYGRHKVKRQKNQISVDDGTALVQSTGTFQVSRNLTIFCLRSSTATAENFTTMKLYSFKLWDGDDLIRDMIPVKRNYDGAIGMYDNINKKFYANAGTGTFNGGD